MFKRFATAALITVLLTTSLSGCLRTKNRQSTQTTLEQITLTVYGLFDSETVYQGAIQDFAASHPTVNIRYKRFSNPEEYRELIVNELAEGEGPDVWLMHNTWFPRDYKKLSPAPRDIVTPEVFRSLFVDVTGDELIIPDDNGIEQVWGMPLYVDTLALYYNDDIYEDRVPSRGEPADTWAGIAEDVTLINTEDQSFERFERAGIALGRTDNILRAFDIVMSMVLQSKVAFYNDTLSKTAFGSDSAMAEALNLYASFGLQSQKNYSWNAYLADDQSAEKEITTFARGKVAMIMGYSYTYEDIVNEINRLRSLGESTISVNDIKIKETPQIFDPNTSSETREAYASYFVPVVSRTSDHSKEAWEFLATMVSEENLNNYNEETRRPSALRSLISSQTQHPIYGVFASQVGYASSIPMSDPERYEELILGAIDTILSTARAEDVVRTLSTNIQELIPEDGIKPTEVTTETAQ